MLSSPSHPRPSAWRRKLLRPGLDTCGLMGTGNGPAPAMSGYPADGSAGRARQLFGWKGIGCVAPEVGSGWRVIGARGPKIASSHSLRSVSVGLVLFQSGGRGYSSKAICGFKAPIPVALFGTIQAV